MQAPPSAVKTANPPIGNHGIHISEFVESQFVGFFSLIQMILRERLRRLQVQILAAVLFAAQWLILSRSSPIAEGAGGAGDNNAAM